MHSGDDGIIGWPPPVLLLLVAPPLLAPLVDAAEVELALEAPPKSHCAVAHPSVTSALQAATAPAALVASARKRTRTRTRRSIPKTSGARDATRKRIFSSGERLPRAWPPPAGAGSLRWNDI